MQRPREVRIPLPGAAVTAGAGAGVATGEDSAEDELLVLERDSMSLSRRTPLPVGGTGVGNGLTTVEGDPLLEAESPDLSVAPGRLICFSSAARSRAPLAPRPQPMNSSSPILPS